MYSIWKEVEFSSAHAIRGHQGGCENIHGHNYRVRVWVGSETLNELGMVMDFKELKSILKEIAHRLDHKNLNEIPPFTEMATSAEQLAEYFFQEVERSIAYPSVKVLRVEVYETPTSCAVYQKK